MDKSLSKNNPQKKPISIGCAENTPLGPVWVAVSEAGVAALEIGGQREPFLQSLARRGYAPVVNNPQRVTEAIRQIEEYLVGQRRDFNLPVDWSSLSVFQAQVLRRVAAIPYGQVATYAQVARQVGKPQAPRAVGRANATNPLPLVIPCHRVIGTDGELHGYGAPGGIVTKKWLLELEKSYR